MKQGWEYKKLGDCTQILDSQRKPVTKKDRTGGIYPYYGATGIQDYVDKYIFDGRYALVGEDGAKWSAFEQSAFIIEGKSWVNNHAHVLKPHDFLVDTFLIYFLNYSDLDSYISGAIVRKLTQASLRNIEIPLPPKSTQLAIVSELDKINELIRLKKEQLKDFDNLAQSIFYEMFGDPVENEMGWEVKKLGEVCSVGTGSTPNRKNKDFYENGIYPWVKSTEVCNLPIYSVEEYITQEALDKTNCTLYPQNTILMAMYGQGKTRGQIGLLKIEACTNQAVAAIVPTKEVVDENYICLHLMLMYEHIRNMARGGNQANLNLSIVKSIQIILPPLSLQHLFAQRIEQIEHQKAEVQKAIADLETLLASRMQYWFE